MLASANALRLKIIGESMLSRRFRAISGEGKPDNAANTGNHSVTGDYPKDPGYYCSSSDSLAIDGG